MSPRARRRSATSPSRAAAAIPIAGAPPVPAGGRRGSTRGRCRRNSRFRRRPGRAAWRCGRSRSRRGGSAASSPDGPRPAANPIRRRSRRRGSRSVRPGRCGPGCASPCCRARRPSRRRRGGCRPACTPASCNLFQLGEWVARYRRRTRKTPRGGAYAAATGRSPAAFRRRGAGFRGCAHADADDAPPRRPANAPLRHRTCRRRGSACRARRNGRAAGACAR